MRGIFLAAGFFALLLACFLDASTALDLRLMANSSVRNLYIARCEEGGGAGNPATGATLTLNATTPPTDCFSMTTISAGEIMFNFTISCEGFLQCKNNDDCSESRKLEAYPALPDPPSDSRRSVQVLAGQDEPLVLESNVQSSITGQVEVMWEFRGTGQPIAYPPNGDNHSLVLNRLTAANAGEYFPVARTTSLSLTNSEFKMVSGQHYLIKVDIFDPPHFTNNLSCQEAPQQMWVCSTQATGSEIAYDWFINYELVNSDDSRVSRIVQSEIVLQNLQSSDMHLMVQVHSSIHERSYRINQSAAILVPSTRFPTTQPVQTDETCLLPWIPIVGTTGAVIGLLLISNLGFFICLCRYHGRQQRLHAQLKAQGDHQPLVNVNLQVPAEAENFTLPPLPKGELQNYDCVVSWLTNVISKLKRNVVEGNKDLCEALEKLYEESLKRLRVECEGDESNDEENRSQIIKLKEALGPLLGRE